MRLVTRRIWRAFPELDRFSDEQCARFVGAANSRLRWRILRWLLVACAFVFGVCFPFAVFALEVRLVRANLLARPVLAPLLTGGMWQRTLWGLALTLVAQLAFGAALGFLVRDGLLRLRVRSVLRIRGVCRMCHYPLAGLPVEPSLQVPCPECGHRTDVDPSLGELTTAADGRAMFTPSKAMIERSDPNLFWKKLWIVTKWAGSVALVLLLGSSMALGLYEWDLRRQAQRALALPHGLHALMELRARMWAEGHGGAVMNGVNAYDLLPDIERAFSDAETRLWPAGRPDAIPETAWTEPLDPYLVYRRPGEQERNDPADSRSGREQALRMVAELERCGAYDQMAAMGEAPVCVPPIRLAAGESLVHARPTAPEVIRRMAGWCAARAAVCAQAGDAAGVQRSLQTGFGLARVIDTALDRYTVSTALQIRALLHEQARTIISSAGDEAVIRAAEAAITAEPPLPPQWALCESEKVLVLDVIRWYFSDVSRTRWGMHNPGVTGFLGARPGGRLGTLEENIAVFSKILDEEAAAARVPRPARPPWAPRKTTSDLAFVAAASSGHTAYTLEMMDQSEVDRRGVLIISGLERFRLKHGDYPDSLSQLVPGLMTVLPTDPWSGGPYRYKRVSPSEDELHRGYVLYIPGKDGVDDGGLRGGADALHGAPIGHGDYVINSEPP